jgi:hypothetical protein
MSGPRVFVEKFGSRRLDDLCSVLEFRPGETGSGQYSLEIPAPMKLTVKGFVAC